jgi:hypothetical protein
MRRVRNLIASARAMPYRVSGSEFTPPTPSRRSTVSAHDFAEINAEIRAVLKGHISVAFAMSALSLVCPLLRTLVSAAARPVMCQGTRA